MGAIMFKIKPHTRQRHLKGINKTLCRDFPAGTLDKNPPAKAGDMGSIPHWGRPHEQRRN